MDEIGEASSMVVEVVSVVAAAAVDAWFLGEVTISSESLSVRGYISRARRTMRGSSKEPLPGEFK